MPGKSRKPTKKNGSKSQSQHHNQHGGTTGQQPEVPQISQATLEQAGKIAQQFLNNAMSQNNGQKGGSAGGDGSSTTQTAATSAQAEGLQTAMVEGAVAGANAGAIAAAEGYSSLHGSPLVGGRRSKQRRGRGRGRKTQGQSNSQSNSSSHSHSQKGGMVPGLMTAVETALVPLGLYLGQKALQSRRSGNRSLGNSFNFRRSSRRTRRRR